MREDVFRESTNVSVWMCGYVKGVMIPSFNANFPFKRLDVPKPTTRCLPLAE